MENLIELASAGVGVLLSLVFEFFPRVNTWFDTLSKYKKQLMFGGLALVLGAVVFGLNCIGWLAYLTSYITLTCSPEDAVVILRVAVGVVGGAQITHLTVNNGVKMLNSKSSNRTDGDSK